jgi:hypothetical protein
MVLGLAAVAAVDCFALPPSFEAQGTGAFVSPEAESLQATLTKVLFGVTVLVMLLAARLARHLPTRAARARYFARATLTTMIPTIVSILTMTGASPDHGALLASASRDRGPTAYVYRHASACAYKLGVSTGRDAVRPFASFAPVACDAPPPRLEWRGDDVTLRDADGHALATWGRPEWSQAIP